MVSGFFLPKEHFKTAKESLETEAQIIRIKMDKLRAELCKSNTLTNVPCVEASIERLMNVTHWLGLLN